jgi:hypothetical protein
MPPIPENNTPVWFVDYQQGDFNHTFQVRSQEGESVAGFDAAMLALLPDVGGLVVAGLITGVRFRDAGSDIAVPVDSERIGDTFGSGSNNPDVAPLSIRFVGRDSIGVRVSITFFGYRLGTSSWRLTSTENADVADVVATLNSGPDFFVTIAQNKPIWYPYANINAHDHWVKRARG